MRQQNLNQEYINVTRGVIKTCMWVELQPFGHPGDPKEPSDGHFDINCGKYARNRSWHIWDKELRFATLTDRSAIFTCFRDLRLQAGAEESG